MRDRGHRVTVVIPNYDSREHLARLLSSIANQTYRDFEVIVIDDFSPDRSVPGQIRDLTREHDNFRLVENTQNLGFVRTCNKGIRLSSGEYVCVLTNDTQVTSGFVQRNVEIMDADSSIGVLSCIIVDRYGDNWFSGGVLREWAPVSLLGDFEGVRTVDWVAGTAPFYRKKVFDEVGLLNEDFFMYHEDVEFCLRVQHRTNYRVCMFPEKLVTHYLEPNPAKLSAAYLSRLYYYGHRNHLLMVRRYCPEYVPRIVLRNAREAMNAFVVPFLNRRPGRSLLSASIIRGTLDGLAHRQKA